MKNRKFSLLIPILFGMLCGSYYDSYQKTQTIKDQEVTINQLEKAIVDAVNNKNKAVQDAMTVENQLRVAEAKKKKMIIEAEGEKAANELKQRSLSPLLIQQQFIEKWDGKTPLYGNVPTFFKNVK